jgi:hypothetical protein
MRTGQSAKRSRKLRSAAARAAWSAPARHLLAGLHGDERGAHRDLGLAEADVAADDAVHRLLGPGRSSTLRDGLGLVGGLLEREGVGERLVLELAQRQRFRPLRALRCA